MFCFRTISRKVPHSSLSTPLWINHRLRMPSNCFLHLWTWSYYEPEPLFWWPTRSTWHARELYLRKVYIYIYIQLIIIVYYNQIHIVKWHRWQMFGLHISSKVHWGIGWNKSQRWRTSGRHFDSDKAKTRAKPTAGIWFPQVNRKYYFCKRLCWIYRVVVTVHLRIGTKAEASFEPAWRRVKWLRGFLGKRTASSKTVRIYRFCETVANWTMSQCQQLSSIIKKGTIILIYTLVYTTWKN